MKFDSPDAPESVIERDVAPGKPVGNNYKLSCLSSLGSLLAKRQDAMVSGDNTTLAALDDRIAVLRKGYRN
jgi:hypothetical protein